MNMVGLRIYLYAVLTTMCQIFLEHVFEKHVDWTNLIINNDNYKNKLQVIIQKEFKLTPDYVELNNDKDNNTETEEMIHLINYTPWDYLLVLDKIFIMQI